MKNITILTEKWGEIGPLLLLTTKSDMLRVYYHKILHGLLSHQSNKIPMEKKMGGPPLGC